MELQVPKSTSAVHLQITFMLRQPQNSFQLKMLVLVDTCMLCPQTYEEEELLRLVYFGGVEPSLRKEVWPFLLGHYQFGMSVDKRNEVCHSPTFVPLPPPRLQFSLSTPHLQVDEQVRVRYQQTMSEWLSCEEIVRQREKEQHVAALAKCSSGASMDSSSQKMIHRDSISNEVKPVAHFGQGKGLFRNIIKG